jgi:predicted transcriptional regulator
MLRKVGLTPDYSMVAPNYLVKSRALAKQVGLGRKSATPPAIGEAKAPAQERRLITGSDRTTAAS